MTAKKKAKRAVRARAQRTGLSYAATLQATKPKEESPIRGLLDSSKSELFFQTREEAAEKAISIMTENSAYDAFAMDNPERALWGVALASSNPEDPEYFLTWPIFDKPFTPEVHEVTSSEFNAILLDTPNAVIANRIASRQFGVLKYLPDQGKTLVYLSSMFDFKSEEKQAILSRQQEQRDHTSLAVAGVMQSTATARRAELSKLKPDLKHRLMILYLFSPDLEDRSRLIASLLTPIETMWGSKVDLSMVPSLKEMSVRMDLVLSIFQRQGYPDPLDQVTKHLLRAIREQVAGELEPESEDIQWLRTIDSCLSQHESVWTDLPAMVACVRAHVQRTGRPVLAADAPTRLMLGYCDSVTGQTWKIRLTDAKRGVGENKTLEYNLQTPEGRLRLVNDSTS